MTHNKYDPTMKKGWENLTIKIGKIQTESNYNVYKNNNQQEGLKGIEKGKKREGVSRVCRGGGTHGGLKAGPAMVVSIATWDPNEALRSIAGLVRRSGGEEKNGKGTTTMVAGGIGIRLRRDSEGIKTGCGEGLVAWPEVGCATWLGLWWFTTIGLR
ncbi:unnamed protein product [Sphenostylis stenocarpa]|uniref:Uncharacterized protein n=1 Tax=Sphenostylis stenocarpa TaxID=92480 RepID=A0AA86VU20_9FABA|nr:unnamed protein product [Sphenostylis stenocarpa]